jgi:hypothetical protein
MMRLPRRWIYVAIGGALLVPAAPAPAQGLGGVVGSVTQPVAQTVEQVAQAAEPVVQPVAKVVQPVVEPAEPVVEAAEPVVEAAEPVVEAAQPVTDTVTAAAGSATGGQGSGGDSGSGGSGSGSSSGGGSGSDPGAATAGSGSKARYVVVNGKRCRPGQKQQAAAAGGTFAGGPGGPGDGSSSVLARDAAERSFHVALAERQAQERVTSDHADGDGVLGASGEDEGGVLSIPGIIGDPDEYPFGAGIALLALFGLGLVGVVAGVTSHLIGRIRSG